MKSKPTSRKLAECLAQAANILPVPSPRRFTMKRVPTAPKPSLYLDWESRCKFAFETLRSIKASPAEQMIELELMLQGDLEGEED